MSKLSRITFYEMKKIELYLKIEKSHHLYYLREAK